MLSPHIRERLKDPRYCDMHLKAVAVLRGVSGPKWYDAHFLTIYEAARRFIGIVRPERLKAFEESFEILRTPKDFQLQEVADLFDAATQSSIRQTIAEIASDRMEDHEITDFGRLVVHDHPFFTHLQQGVTARASEMAGCPLKPGYNFLSLYGSAGKCDLHMDHPLSMYTLDYCIDQNVEWPIYFSDILDWPDPETLRDWKPEVILADPAIRFEEKVLEPGQAIFFSGSGQWHYRKPIPRGGFSHLLFFHFYPEGAENLVHFAGWASRFDIPELEALCDIFAEEYPQLVHTA